MSDEGRARKFKRSLLREEALSLHCPRASLRGTGRTKAVLRRAVPRRDGSSQY